MTAPYPVPPATTVTVGQAGTSSLWSTGPAAALGFLPNRPNAVLWQSAVQSIPSYQNVAIALDGWSRDNASGHSTSVNNSQYVCQLAGIYSICGHVAMRPPSTGAAMQVFIRVNSGWYYAPAAFYLDNNTTGGTLTVACELQLWPGWYVELVVYQGSGQTLSTGTNYARCHLSLAWVST